MLRIIKIYLPKLTNKGFSLVEVLVSVMIVSILSLGIFSLIILSIKISTENQYYIEAIGIANQKMERIRNMAYDDVGVVAGIPSGNIPQVEPVIQKGNYTVNSYVTFFDDAFDGEAGSSTKPDTIPVDYKIATIKVSWQGKYGAKNVTIFSKIIPRTEETTAGYGLLKLSVVDANGLPIIGASTTLINIASGTNVTNLTNSEGLLYLPVPACYQCYKIIVGKTGYGIDQTYPITINNPQPTKINLSVTEGNKTEESFSIDRLATLNIRTLSNNLPTNWQVNATIPNEDKTGAKMSIDNSDNMYFVWQNTSAATSTIYLQKYNSAQVKQWADDKIVYANSKFQKNPDIAVAQNGQSFIVWQDNSATLKLLAKKDSKNHLAIAKIDRSKENVVTKKENFTKDINKIKKENLIQTQLLSIKNHLLSYTDKIKNKLSLSNHILKYAISKISKYNLFDANLNIKTANAGIGVVSFVGVGPGVAQGASNSITLSVPAGSQNGDLLIAFLYQDDYGEGPISPPAGYGWNTLDNDMRPDCCFNRDSRGAIFWKIVSTGNPSSYTFRLPTGNSERMAGHIRAYRGADTSSPFDGGLLDQTSGTGDILRPAPSHTVNNDNSILICGWGSDAEELGNNSPTFPASMSHSIDNYANNITAVSADKIVNISDSPTGNQNYDANRSVPEKSINWSLVIKPAVIPDDVTVSATNNQTATMLIPSDNQYVGGKFIFVDNTGSHTINSMTITEQGTVNSALSLENVKIYYDFDTSAPYDCADEQYNAGADAQFGAAVAFNASNQATFNGSLDINTTKSLCAYIVLDVNANAEKNQTIDISINDPTTEIVLASGTVIPNSPIIINGTTLLQKPSELQQIYYRWRNDDGDEATATWKASQNSASTIMQNENIRLRIEVNNNGSIASDLIKYRLEYAEKQTTCSAIPDVSWISIPSDNSQHWKINDSSNLTNNDPSSNSSGMADANTDFKTGELKDVDNETSAIILTPTEFTELEFSLQATNNAIDSDYCFRLTNAGSTANFIYLDYPEISIIGDNNIYIISYNNAGAEEWTVKKVNTDGVGSNAQQYYPVIALTENFGTATTVVAWEDYRNGNSDIYAQSFDKNGNKLWANDVAIANTADDEYSVTITINNNDEIYFAWTADPVAANSEIYVGKFDLDGNSLRPNKKIAYPAGSNAYWPNLTLGDNNNLYLTWTEDNATDKNVMLAKFNSNFDEPAIWSSAANIEQGAKDQYDSFAAFKNSYLYASWTDKRENNEDIYVQKFDLNGNMQWLNDLRINIHPDISNQNSSVLIINSANEPFGTWSDFRNSASNIYATKFNDPGALIGVANVPLIISGTSKIGENPVILENVFHYYTDASGNLSIILEWDTPGYNIETNPASTSLNIILSDPTQPVSILPNETKEALIYVE